MPGRRKVFISGIEADPPGGSFGGIASVAGLIIITIPYDGQFLKLGVNTSNVAPLEDVMLTYNVGNLGTVPITGGLYEMDIFLGDQLVNTVGGEYDLENMPSAQVNLGTYEPGSYTVIATFYVNDLSWEVTNNFLVANNEIEITCPALLYSPQLHNVNFPLSSGYLDSITGDLSFSVDGNKLGQDSVMLLGLDQTEASLYVDLSEKEEGDYSYTLDYGQYASCTGSLTVQGAQSAPMPVFVYYLGGGIILVVCALCAWYYLRDREEEDEF